MTSRSNIQRANNAVIERLKMHIKDRGALCVIKAPPGSGKTYTLLAAVAFAVETKQRVAIATQTNAQADDVCRRLRRDHREIPVVRFAAGDSSAPKDLEGQVQWITKSQELSHQAPVVVSTTAKWSLVNLPIEFDVLFIDEAWQMAWSDLMLLNRVAPRFILIGDPGQIPPVVSIPVHRWETSPRAPHRPAPEIILSDDGLLATLLLELPSCRRLPVDSVDLIRPFYDFPFEAWAMPGDRFLQTNSGGKMDSIDQVIRLLQTHSAAIATLPTPECGPALGQDDELAALAATFVKQLLSRQAVASDDDDRQARPLEPRDIGITATHRAMNSALLNALPPKWRNQESGIRVDTPERWQGLERKVMIVIHPLSGVVQPSAFDLETGRLCVMASRHRAGMIVLSRDHVYETLDTHIPSADQALGRPDVTGRGHAQNLRFWETLAKNKCVIPCS